MQHSVNTDYFDYLILIAPGPKISINADAHGTSGAVVAANFTPDVWNHVGLRYANRILTLYLNGINMGSATFNLSTPSPANGPLTFGGGSGYYEGLLDDIRIYNRALSAEEIYALSKE